MYEHLVATSYPITSYVLLIIHHQSIEEVGLNNQLYDQDKGLLIVT